MQHLKYHDRVLIEFEISENPDSTLRSVAEKLGVSRSTVMREIIRNSTVTKAWSPAALPNANPPVECPKLRRWPYCCNRCAKTRCHLTRLHYRAGEAERTSKATNAKAARKPSGKTLRRAAEVEAKVVPAIMAGQSIEAAVKAVGCDVHPTTIRRWIDRDLISPSRVDLPRAAKFRPKSPYDYSKAKRSDAPARITFGRTIADYRAKMSDGRRHVAVQCDTVVGTVHDARCILTVMVVRPKARLQFGFRVRKSKEAVKAKLLWLWEAMDAHGCAFDVLLTDNGPEFYGVAEIEGDDAGVHRFNAYFTDPYNSSQKAECESNHRLCRYGQGKGESIDDSSDQEIIDLFSMINSYPRESLGWLSPFQAFKKAFPDSAGLIAALGYREVPADQVKFKKK